MRAAEIPLAGAHTLETWLAAVIITRPRGSGRTDDCEGGEEFLRELSTGWSSLADIRGVLLLQRFESNKCGRHAEGAGRISRRILVILGGKDKGSDYTAIAETAAGKSHSWHS